jgi:hypothetical protein
MSYDRSLVIRPTSVRHGSGSPTGVQTVRVTFERCRHRRRGASSPVQRKRRSMIAGALSVWSALIPGLDATQGRAGTLANPLAAQSLDHLSGTRERPLFSPTRRPPPPPATEAAPPSAPPPAPVPPPDIALLGVVLDGENARAIVRAGAAEKPMRLRVGDEIEGWKITAIERRHLVLSRDDRSATVMLSSGRRTDQARTTVTPMPRAPLSQTRAVVDDDRDPKVRRRRPQ